MTNNSFNPFAIFFGKTTEQQLSKELSKIQAAKLRLNLQLLQFEAEAQGIRNQLSFLKSM